MHSFQIGISIELFKILLAVDESGKKKDKSLRSLTRGVALGSIKCR